MKRSKIMGAFLAGLLSAPAFAQENMRLCVASDVHVMSPVLMRRDGKAYAGYMASDRKMLKESPALLDAFTSEVLKERPGCVLITGDLTKDGECVSHEYLIEHSLKKMREAGIRVLVIPGNHDVNNPHAVEFDGDTTKRVPAVSRQEFAMLYKDYGYGDATARDSVSLSYVCQLSPSTRILALDACEYYRNDFSANKCYHEGVLRDATLSFAKTQLEEANRVGQKVVVMMHHGITEHWKYQNRVLPGYVADNAAELVRLLKKNDVHVVFTGHLHTQDITEASSGIFDIETGSLVSYASSYRMATLTADSIFVTTRRLERVPGLQLSVPFQEYAREHTASGVRSIVGRMFPADVPETLKNEVVEAVAQAMMDNYRGDERLSEETEGLINSLARQFKKYSLKWSIIFKRVGKSLLTDLSPADGEFSTKL